MSKTALTSALLLSMLILSTSLTAGYMFVPKASAWSNGGFSSNPANPDYGTHDWIAQHALDWLPTNEKQYILDNLAAYLFGTELPDNSQAPGGFGDTGKHIIYYNKQGVMTYDAAADRASTEYAQALAYLNAYDLTNGAKTAGIMSHYIVDVAVFGHVMGKTSDWGDETHHDDYEREANHRTNSYSGAEFNSYLVFDGSLINLSAYDAAKNIAYDTTFDPNGAENCTWMDQNYNWNNPTFVNRAGESLNLAVNTLADVLHTLYKESALAVPEFPPTALPIILVVMTLAAVIIATRTKKRPNH